MLCATVTAAQRTPVDSLPELQLAPEVIQDSPTILIYPNPTTGSIKVNWNARALFRMPVEVRTMDGHLVRMDSLAPDNALDVSMLPDGLYRLYLLDISGVRAVGTFRVQR